MPKFIDSTYKPSSISLGQATIEINGGSYKRIASRIDKENNNLQPIKSRNIDGNQNEKT